MPKVSVVIPAFNGARTIPRALASVFAQTNRDYEVIVIDDGSTDDTRSVLAGYSDRIRVIAQPNRGVSSARNAGVRASSGEYIAFLDDDDEWMPEKLARCVPVLEQDPGCAMVYNDIFKVDLSGRATPNQDRQTVGIDTPTLAQMLARPWNVVPSQLVVRRDVFERCAGFDERLINGEDIFFLLRAREHGHFRYVPEVLLRKTMRPLFPTTLNRERGCGAFIHAVRERYGAQAAGLIREFRINRMKVMKHMANLLLQEGRTRDARRCLARVIYYQPASPKAYRRYLKTFLPARTPRIASSTEDSEA